MYVNTNKFTAIIEHRVKLQMCWWETVQTMYFDKQSGKKKKLDPINATDCEN